MNLDLYISELLYEHDCVIIPGFGGIVTNYRSSFLNPAHHTFSPPSKKLAFNASLRNNDGLLANHLCNRLSINYQEANNMISSFVNLSMVRLNDGKKLFIEQVGTLYFDKEHNLQFASDVNTNYLKASFGLTNIHSPAIKRSQKEEEVTPFTVLQGSFAKSKRKNRAWRFIEVVPVAALLALLVLNPNVIRQLNQQAAALFPFEQQTPVLPVAKQSVLEKDAALMQDAISTNEDNEFELPAVAKSVDNTTVFDMPKETNEVPAINLRSEVDIANETATPVKEIKETVKAEIVKPAKSSGRMYYVIGGCFGVFENATKFRDELIAEGFQAAIIGQNDNGLHMVSFFSTADVQRANEELALIKEKAEANAWLLRK